LEGTLTVRTEAAKVIVKAAKENNIKRIIAIGGAGCLLDQNNKLMQESEHFPK